MTLDTSLATCAGHQQSRGRSFRKQRTVNPSIARSNFLYSSSRPASGRPPAALGRQRRFREAACNHGRGTESTRRDGPPMLIPDADTRSGSDQEDQGKRQMLLLIFVEFLVCLLIWWRGVVIVLGDQPEHRNWDVLQQQRRTDWIRNELQERPVWWLMLTGLMLFVLADWFVDKWGQRPWRAAIIWTIVMCMVLVVVVALTEHFGWAIRPINL
jgi:hypothetical protein